MTAKYVLPVGLGDGKQDASPQVIRTQQQWEETFKNSLGLVVVEFYPPWAAPSSALANAVRRLRPQVSQYLRVINRLLTSSSSLLVSKGRFKMAQPMGLSYFFNDNK